MNKRHIRSFMPATLAHQAERIRREAAVRPLTATERRDIAMIAAEQRRRAGKAVAA